MAERSVVRRGPRHRSNRLSTRRVCTNRGHRKIRTYRQVRYRRRHKALIAPPDFPI